MLMQMALFGAGLLAFATGLVHSLLGERLIFRRLREHGASVTASAEAPAPPATESRRLGILWATWHLASVFGWALGALLLLLALGQAPTAAGVLIAVAAAHLTGAVLVFVGTHGRHPGWIALSVVGLVAAVAAVAAGSA